MGKWQEDLMHCYDLDADWLEVVYHVTYGAVISVNVYYCEIDVHMFKHRLHLSSLFVKQLCRLFICLHIRKL